MRVEWKKRAVRQLENAVTYGQMVFGRKAAIKFYRQVKSNDSRLAENPYLGSSEPLFAHRKTQYRSLVVHEHYKLIYWVDEKKGILFISALLDVRREPDKLIHLV
ncbi:type II toxin-antitoxin system RelE/ParE family toxin [Bacteroides sp.]